LSPIFLSIFHFSGDTGDTIGKIVETEEAWQAGKEKIGGCPRFSPIFPDFPDFDRKKEFWDSLSDPNYFNYLSEAPAFPFLYPKFAFGLEPYDQFRIKGSRDFG